MTTSNKLSTTLAGWLVVLGAVLPLTAEAQWVFVAHHAMNRIQQVTHDQDGNDAQDAQTQQRVTQVATVFLDMTAKRAYEVATNSTKNNPNVTVVGNDPSSKTIRLQEDDQIATLTITALNKSTSQLMIIGSAPAGENPQTTRIVNAALKLCNDMGKKCEVSSN